MRNRSEGGHARPNRLLELAGRVLAPLAGALLACTQPPAPAPMAAPRNFALTLITGDQVKVTRFPDGKETALIVPASRGAGAPEVGFSTYEYQGHLHVIPDDVADEVGGLLDPDLFDVTVLIEDGYDDATTASLPIIVTYAPSVSDARREVLAQRLPGVFGVDQVQALHSIAGRALRQAKGSAGEFVRLASHLREPLADRARSRQVPEDAAFAGIERIWLDRKARASLQDSVPQIGAPVAWGLGFDGTGVTVAVLDTGIDAKHPDLAGRVAEERNFTADDGVDHFGHGTHVASTMVGTGAASSGLRRGVAPGAMLIAGKVLGDNGSGESSGIIAGMEWAAARARVVNMSLGGGPTDGTDPMSQAVDALTAKYGTLFVISAGNSGSDKTIGTPGAATSALTVGAVDKHHQLASFSSRGPRSGDYGLKPDLTAPGVTIIAARAAGTSLGGVFDPFYTALSGTSMAAPHAAGAAALLAQAHPSWKAAELKAALVGTAALDPTRTVYEQGGGEVDLRRAFTQKVFATPASLDLGYLRWPQAGAPPITRTVTYSNLSAREVRLSLTVNVRDRRGTGEAVPPGALTLSQPVLQIPAGGTASVDLTLDPVVGSFGLYGGYLVAEQRDDDDIAATLHTPIGFTREAETHTVTVQGIARNGSPARIGTMVIMNVDDSAIFFTGRLIRGSQTWRVPSGTYAVLGDIFTLTDNVFASDDVLVGKPELRVFQDTTLVLDAREAKEIAIETPGHETKKNFHAAQVLGWLRKPALGNGAVFRRFTHVVDNRLFMQPADPVTKGQFEAFSAWHLEAPDIKMRLVSSPEVELHPEYVAFADARFDGVSELQIVNANFGYPADYAALDVKGKLALVKRRPNPSATGSRLVGDQIESAAAAGAAGVLIYNDRPGSDFLAGNGTIPALRLSGEEGAQVLSLLSQGAARARLEGIARSPYVYDLALVEKGGIRQEPSFVADQSNLATLSNVFYTHKPDRPLSEFRAFRRPLERQSSVVARTLLAMPGRRTEFVSSGDTVWSQGVWAQAPYGLVLQEFLTSYQPGETRSQTWFKQPLRSGIPVMNIAPGQRVIRPAFRFGDTFFLDFPSYLDAQGHWGFGDGANQIAWRLFRDGRLLGSSKWGVATQFEVGAGEARFRLEVDVDKGADAPPFVDWRTLSTSIRTAWTFTSSQDGTNPQSLPLLQLDYDAGVDLLNRVSKGTSIAIRARHQEGVPKTSIERIKVQISFDDGKSWRRLHGDNDESAGGFRSEIGEIPPGASFLSLKTEARDEAGNRVEEEILRAFAVKPGGQDLADANESDGK